MRNWGTAWYQNAFLSPEGAVPPLLCPHSMTVLPKQPSPAGSPSQTALTPLWQTSMPMK